MHSPPPSHHHTRPSNTHPAIGVMGNRHTIMLENKTNEVIDIVELRGLIPPKTVEADGRTEIKPKMYDGSGGLLPLLMIFCGKRVLRSPKGDFLLPGEKFFNPSFKTVTIDQHQVSTEVVNYKVKFQPRDGSGGVDPPLEFSRDPVLDQDNGWSVQFINGSAKLTRKEGVTDTGFGIGALIFMGGGRCHAKMGKSTPVHEIDLRDIETDELRKQPYWTYNDAKLAIKVERQGKDGRGKNQQPLLKDVISNEGSGLESKPVQALKPTPRGSRSLSTVHDGDEAGKKFDHEECSKILMAANMETEIDWSKPPIYDEYPEEDDDSEELKLLTTRNSPQLHISSLTVNSKKRKVDDWDWLDESVLKQRTKIFETYGVIRGTECSFVMDSGSGGSYVSANLVSFFNLSTEDLANPYHVLWVNHEARTLVTNQCLVEFSIGHQYEDKIWCDVMRMDSCHVLLGRPWQWDRNVYYRGHLKCKDDLGRTVCVVNYLMRQAKLYNVDRSKVEVAEVVEKVCVLNELCAAKGGMVQPFIPAGDGGNRVSGGDDG
ncbi:hypothetical protein RHSIM_RhsimUnG0245700 [Rhododendron simsii]|uniref:Uncharacterized protein n=1 Tax=Rhododendron simsii TaxID=118357 RepID=A0A834L3A2_RHOSS|nr:hypothetical protein RHSIM_RhsimUnG0245700 [Rhododendron simsii]